MNKIKYLKKHRNLTDKDIAQILASNHGYYYSRVSISGWINGYYRCPEEVITVLAGPDLLDVDNEHLGELFDEVYSEKHPNPPDQMCIDECVNTPSPITHQYMSYSKLCEMFEGQIPYSDLKLLLNGFNYKADDRGMADVLAFTNKDWDRVLYPLWNNGSSIQSSYNKVLVKLYDLGLYKLEDSHE